MRSWCWCAEGPAIGRRRLNGPLFSFRFPNGRLCDRALWQDVFDVDAIGEFDQPHFYIAGFCQITGSGHHAFQPLKIGGDQRRVVTVGQLCLGDNFQTCLGGKSRAKAD